MVAVLRRARLRRGADALRRQQRAFDLRKVHLGRSEPGIGARLEDQIQMLTQTVFRLLLPKIPEKASLYSSNIILFLFGKFIKTGKIIQ